MSIKESIFTTACSSIKEALVTMLPRTGRVICAGIADRFIPSHTVSTPLGELKFICPGPIPFFRAESLLTKEPETIEWINTFSEGDVLWDIGANIGVYSLYAALIPKVRVVALEPSALNYNVLTRNIECNKMGDRIQALCIALDSETKLASFNLSSMDTGGSINEFGSESDSVGCVGEEFSVVFRQAMLGFSGDDFISMFSPPFPNHIKIDVDGNEDRIIRGMIGILKDVRLKSLLVELDTTNQEYCSRVIQQLSSVGFNLSSKGRAEIFKDGQFATIFNHIFTREQRSI